MKKVLLVAIVISLTIFSSCKSDRDKEGEEGTVALSGPVFGIDVSQYNGDIDWYKVKNQTKTKDPIRFVIIRSTVGVDKDTRYAKNYENAKQNGFIVGTYHYFRPNENSTKQFENFKAVVRLEKGDVLPVIDIEVNSRVQSMNSLKVGLRNFIDLVEKHYGVKPIIYTKLSMWRDYLVSDFSDCQLWVAAYSISRCEDPIVRDAAIHQFTKEIQNIPGIPERYVDGDDIRDIQAVLY